MMKHFYQDYSKSRPHAATEVENNCRYMRHKTLNTDKLTRFLSENEKKNKKLSIQSNNE